MSFEQTDNITRSLLHRNTTLCRLHLGRVRGGLKVVEQPEERVGSNNSRGRSWQRGRPGESSRESGTGEQSEGGGGDMESIHQRKHL